MEREFVRIVKLDLKQGTCKTIYPSNQDDSVMSFDEFIDDFIKSKMLYLDDYNLFRDFFNLDVMKKRLSYNGSLECVYRRIIGNEFFWVRGVVKKESDEIAQLRVKKIEKANNIIHDSFNLLAVDSFKIIEANLTTNEYVIDGERYDVSLNDLLLEGINNDIIDNDYKYTYVDFVSNLNKSIEIESTLKFTYLINYNNEKKYNQIEVVRDDDYTDDNKKVIIYINDINVDILDRSMEYEMRIKTDAVFSNISSDYCAILLIDLENNLCDSIKQPEELNNNTSIYTDLIKDYMNVLIDDKYKGLFKDVFSLDNLRQIKYSSETTYIFKNKNERFLEVCLTPYYNNSNYIVALFKYRDDYIKGQINQMGFTLSVEKIYDIVIAIDVATNEFSVIKCDWKLNSRTGKVEDLNYNLKNNILDNYLDNYKSLINASKEGKSFNTEIGILINGNIYYYEVFLTYNKIYEENNYLILAKNITERVNDIIKNNVLSATVSKAFEAILTINLNTLNIELLGENKTFFEIFKINDYNELYNIGMKLITNKTEETLNYFKVETLKNILDNNLTSDTFLDIVYEGVNMRINVVTFAVAGVEDSVIMLFRNVSRAYKMELESKRLITDALERAEYANNAKSLFLSKVSHDIRTPLNAIIGMTYLLKKGKIDEKTKMSYLSKIEVSGNHLLGIINEILDMNIIESGLSNVAEDTIDLNDFFNDIVAMMTPEITEKNLEFKTKINVTNQLVVTDNVKLRKIVSNLLSNAMKYTKEGTVTFEINEKKSRKKTARYEFIIQDTGVGIEEDFMDKLFVPFERGYDTRINKIQGTGLGMPIVKNLVEMLDGSIKIESKVNEGTKAIVNLELILKHDNIINNPFGYNESFVGSKVLLVEDNEINQEILSTILESFDIEVSLAVDGKKGYEEYLKNDYDLILCDIQMPELDGYELTRMIRESRKHDSKTVKIIAVTANAFSSHVEKSYQVGMNDHLSKPIVVNELLRILNKYL